MANVFTTPPPDYVGTTPGGNSVLSFLESKVTVAGREEILTGWRNVAMGMREAAIEEIDRASQELMDLSLGQVPYDTGALYESAYREQGEESGVQMWVVGYRALDVPYAWAVHEIPATHPTRGPRPESKKDHYLSDPADEIATKYPDEMSTVLRSAIQRASKPRLVKKS